MKIGIDIRSVCGRKTGKGWYTYHLVKNLLELDRENEYILYANAITADAAAFQNTHIKIIAKHPLLWHFAVIKDFKREGGELFFAPTSYLIPALLPKTIKSVMTVHDLIAFRYPLQHHRKSMILEQLFLKKALKRATRALVPSQNTKKDLMRLFHYEEERIAVAPLGVDEKFFEKTDHKLQTINYKLPKEFILTVGGLEPRKNISRLVDAFINVILKQTQDDLKLVVVGGRGWQSKKLRQKIAAHRDRIIHIENCRPEDLPAFYRAAKIFVFPSLYEGFGLPPLEAMASGCPVICSNASSLPEVCGDAALFIHPENTQEIAAAIEKLLHDEKLRAELIQKGLVQTKKFSWQKTAETTLKVFNSL